MKKLNFCDQLSISISEMKFGQKYKRTFFWQGGNLRLCHAPSEFSRPPPDLLILAAVSCLGAIKIAFSIFIYFEKVYQFNL